MHHHSKHHELSLVLCIRDKRCIFKRSSLIECSSYTLHNRLSSASHPEVFWTVELTVGGVFHHLIKFVLSMQMWNRFLSLLQTSFPTEILRDCSYINLNICVNDYVFHVCMRFTLYHREVLIVIIELIKCPSIPDCHATSYVTVFATYYNREFWELLSFNSSLRLTIIAMKYTANDTIPIKMCPVNAALNDKAVAAMYKTDVFIFYWIKFCCIPATVSRYSIYTNIRIDIEITMVIMMSMKSSTFLVLIFILHLTCTVWGFND